MTFYDLHVFRMVVNPGRKTIFNREQFTPTGSIEQPSVE